MRNKVIFIIGPTAAGKTRLALEIARVLPCEIVSVDSALIYRSMDIGTAKPDPQTLAAVPHHLVDLLDPAQCYSVAEFCNDARTAIDRILQRNRVPLLVGGTVMYFRALQQGLSKLPPADPAIRRQLAQRARQQGWAGLHRELREVDPESAGKIHPNDPQRIQRALEVYLLTGRPLSRLKVEKPGSHFPYQVLKFIVAYRQRSRLNQPIEQRFTQMLEAGFVAEVERLRARGDLSLELPSMRCVGYRQIWEYLDGHYDYQEMCLRAVRATRQLAKRQYTWLNNETTAFRYALEDGEPDVEIIKKIRQFVNCD